MNTKFIIYVVVGLMILSIGAYLIGVEDENNKNPTNTIEKNNSIIEEITTSAPNIEVQGDLPEPNIKPQFKVEQTFKYKETKKVSGVSVDSDYMFQVERIEKVDGVDCYVVKSTTIGHYVNQDGKTMKITSNSISYIDKETGDIVKLFMGVSNTSTGIVLEKEVASAKGNGMYAPWTLALKEGIKWTQKLNVTGMGGGTMEVEYKVIGIEKVNKRDCFKVEQIIKAKSIKGSETTKISLENTHWVDVNERILVKSESKSGNLKIGEMYLVS